MKNSLYVTLDTDLNKIKKDNFMETITKVNDFTEKGLGLPFTDFLREFVKLYGENLVINANQIIVPSIDQCIRNLFAHKFTENTNYKPVSLSYVLDSFKPNNPEKLSYLAPVILGNNEIISKKLVGTDVYNLDGKTLDFIKIGEESLGDYWKKEIQSYKGFNINFPDISEFWDKITRMILEAKKERINKGNNNLLVDIKITYNGQNYFCSFSKKKNAYSTKKVDGLGDYTSINDLLNNKNIKLALPAKLYYPYVYLPLALFMENFIVDYELDTTGLLDNKLVKEFFNIVGGKLGLIDLGSFYKGTFIEDERFKNKIKALLGELSKGIEDEEWLALSSIITPEVYNNVFNGLEEIKLTTPKKTSNDILNAIAEELKAVL